MIRIKVFKVFADRMIDIAPISSKEKAPVEEFVHHVGYENIKQVLTSSPNSGGSYYYTFFYEDNQPYTPYVEPPKKGIFG
ncbi:MAG TPA: hypothetical protein VN626_08870 [Clostridia bacterium]|nr:hypothetical protein [Clostridia bacterium]